MEQRVWFKTSSCPPLLETTFSYHLLQCCRVSSDLTPCKDQLPEMSEGLVLLLSQGMGMGGGVGDTRILQSSLAPLSFRRPQDVFSKELVHLPRKGRLHFPWTESRISGIFKPRLQSVFIHRAVRRHKETTITAGFVFTWSLIPQYQPSLSVSSQKIWAGSVS